MPDWSYRTLLRPALFRMKPARGRDFALEAMGMLARLPLGGRLIDLLGHMRPDARLRRTLLGVEFASPIGLGPALDVEARALPALARFVVGFIEIAVTATNRSTIHRAVERDDDAQAIRYAHGSPGLAVDELAERLRADAPLGVPLIVRLDIAPAATTATADDECRRMVAAVARHATFMSLGTMSTARAAGWTLDEWRSHVAAVRSEVDDRLRPQAMWLSVPPEPIDETAATWIAAALESGVAGLIVSGERRTTDGGAEFGAPARSAAVDCTTSLRQRFGPDLPIIAGGGVHEPRHALTLLDAGADFVQIDTGLVFSGPGLVKRTNEAVLQQTIASSLPTPDPESMRLVDMAWTWSLLMGLSLLAGGVMAFVIAVTRVVLPYDEMLTGLTRDRLASINENLLAFMTHDRVSLAGTMIAVGVFYSLAAWHEMRRGTHWAYAAVMTSALSGMFTFFAFLGFGYFDPFHAFVTTVLFQFQLMALRGRLSTAQPTGTPDLCDDTAWRTSQWGQLAAVVHGCGLIGAGLTILFIGCTFVLVETDLDFLCTTIDELQAADPHVLPLIAHDRAAFGGMLLAAGLMLTLSSLWGFQRGSRTVWRMLLWGALPGYVAALVVHLAVGYDDVLHLVPVSLGLAATTATLVLSRRYLCAVDAEPVGKSR